MCNGAPFSGSPPQPTGCGDGFLFSECFLEPTPGSGREVGRGVLSLAVLSPCVFVWCIPSVAWGLNKIGGSSVPSAHPLPLCGGGRLPLVGDGALAPFGDLCGVAGSWADLTFQRPPPLGNASGHMRELPKWGKTPPSPKAWPLGSGAGDPGEGVPRAPPGPYGPGRGFGASSPRGFPPAPLRAAGLHGFDPIDPPLAYLWGAGFCARGRHWGFSRPG